MHSITYHGATCRHCGGTERYTSNRNCTACSLARSHARNGALPWGDPQISKAILRWQRAATAAAIAALSLLASGCATCQRHPAACAEVGVFVATSLALSANGLAHRSSPPPVQRNIQPLPCGSITCQQVK